MNFRLIATLAVAGTTCSLASASVNSNVNPKIAQHTYTNSQSSASALQSLPEKSEAAIAARKFAASGGVLSPLLQIGGQRRSNPTGTGGSLPIIGGDDCSAAVVVSGLGSFPYDTTGATSGVPALTCGLGGSDVWFSWVAPSSGNCTFSLCAGTSADSVIAAWAGSGCPGGVPLACNDDFCAGFGPSQVTFAVTAGSNYMLQIGGYNGGVIGAGTFSLNDTPSATNDDCSAAVAVVGVGTFPFDTTGATTGLPALPCGLGGSDVWFSWVAPSTGTALFTLCNGTTADSVIAAWAGSGCPGGTALACNDDTCNFQSQVTFQVTSGSSYMLQIGGFAGGVIGTGTFDLSVIQPPAPCTPWDDGSTENLLGWTAGGDMVWLNRFGAPGQQNTVGSVDVAWGSVMFPGYSTGNGTPTDVFIYQDGVSQDGDPTDATLLVSIPTTVSAVDTDTYVNYPIAPLSITGVFFVGSHLTHTAGQFVAPMDQTTHVFADTSYFFGDNTPGASANYANPGANIQPPFSFDSIGFPAQVLARVNCVTGPATYLCDPGTGGVLACPCANPATGSGRGCDNSSATGGASISGTGSNALATPTLSFTTAGEKPTATTILLQGTAVLSSGVAFGQGVRCTGGVLKRLYVKTAVGGSVTAPDFGAGDVNIPARSATLGDVISAGQSRWYMAYYRDPSVLGGCSALSTFNSTTTAEVQWQ